MTTDEMITAELTEARRLLAMATSFDAGPLLGDVPTGWQSGAINRGLAKCDTWIAIDRPGGNRWFAQVEFASLARDGTWISILREEDAGDRCAFDSPAAAFAALDAWRDARKREIEAAAKAIREREDSR